MKNTKIALATASALLITTAFSNAQTTVGGNMRIGVKGHEKRMHGMKAGGVTTMDMKKMGRNLARVANQGMRKTAGRGR